MKQLTDRERQQVGKGSSAGPDSIFITPPAYGIESIDHTPAEPASEVETPAGAPLQMQAAQSVDGGDASSPPPNRTWLPNSLMGGIEALINSGRSLPYQPWHVVQRKKSEQERSIAQSESAMATKAVGLLKGKLQPLLKAHIFEAKPADGKAVNVASPVGLHAYTGGSLPGTLASVRTEGSRNRVHGLEWKWKTNAATKRSSMFPAWMSADRVCTYIALEYLDNTDVVTEDLTDLLSDNGISKVKVQSRISRGMNPEIEKKGDTVYPVNEGLRDWIEE